MASIGSLFVSISAKTSDFEKSMKEVEKKLTNVGKSVESAGKGFTKFVTGPIAALGGGLLALAVKTGNFADRILDLNAITGMSTDAIQEWQNVSKVAGVNTEAVTNAAAKLTRQLYTMSDGTGKGAEALDTLGISFESLEALSPDARMETLIAALSKVEDPALRAKLGTDLLANSWADIAPIVSLGTAEIDKARQAANDMGNVMGTDALNEANNFRIAMENLKTQMSAAGKGIMADFMPVLTDVLLPIIQEHVVPAIQKLADFIMRVSSAFRELDSDTQKTILAVVGIAAAIGPALLIVAKLIAIVKSLGVALSFLAANPIGLIIVGIAALVTAGILLYKNWDKVKEVAASVWGWISGFMDTTLGKIVAYMMGPIGAGLLIIKNWELIKTTAYEIFNDIKNTISSIWSDITGNIKNGINNVIGFVNTFIDKFNGIKISIPKIDIPSVTILGKTIGGGSIGGQSFGVPQIPNIPQLATGTNMVPQDMLAMLHKGEAVVPAKFNNGAGGQAINVYLDGRIIAQQTAPHMVKMIRQQISPGF
jgi:phage-related minor tail protein